jgi:hypothetical protein
MLEFFKDRGTAELSYFWAGVVLPIITIGAIVFAALQVRYARAQLEEAKRYSRITSEQAQATLLLNLVEKWNSNIMHQSRVEFDKHESKAKDYVYSKYGKLSDNEQTNKLKTYFRASMRSLDKTDNASYGTMLQMLSFFELVGQLVKEGYVRLNDIDALFRGAILDIGCAYVDHIKDEQLKKGFPPGYYENALFLISEIEKICP